MATNLYLALSRISGGLCTDGFDDDRAVEYDQQSERPHCQHRGVHVNVIDGDVELVEAKSGLCKHDKRHVPLRLVAVDDVDLEPVGQVVDGGEDGDDEHGPSGDPCCAHVFATNSVKVRFN